MEAARLLTAAEAQERPFDAKVGAEDPGEACRVTPTANQQPDPSLQSRHGAPVGFLDGKAASKEAPCEDRL